MSSGDGRPSRSDRDLATLTVLALLTTGPRHPYDIHRFVVETRKDFVTGAPRSIYHAVGKLEKAHLIEPVGAEQHGGRPERTVFAITDAGRADVRRRITMLLSMPLVDRAETIAALSFLGILSRDAAVAALRARTGALDAAIQTLSADLDTAPALPPILLIEAEYERAQLRSEREWFEVLLGRLESGELEWLPSDSWR